MSAKVAIQKLANVGFSEVEIREMLSAKWYKIFRTVRNLVQAGLTGEEVDALLSLRREPPAELTRLLHEAKSKDSAAIWSRELERHTATSSPVTPKPPVHPSFGPSGKRDW